MNQTQMATRTRTFSWSDPALTAAQLGRRSGLDTLRAMFCGELPAPPYLDLLGAETEPVNDAVLLKGGLTNVFCTIMPTST